MSDWPNHSRLSALNIRQSIEGSLKRLQTDHIDLYQMHHIDRDTPWEEIWQAMEVLVRQGKILYVGSSNFAGWHIAKGNEIARSHHFLGLVSEQCLYNLTVRTAEMDVLPACRDYGLGVIPWSPLARGLLAGTRGKEQTGRRGEEDVSKEMEKYATQISQYEEFCQEMGQIPANVALAWLWPTRL